jgi:DNA-binding transcriptional LysR family regulator
VLDGALDLVLLPAPVPVPHLATMPLGAVAWGWAAAPGFAEVEGVLGPAAIGALPLVTLGRGSLVHRGLRDWFASHGITPARPMFCTSIHLVAPLAALAAEVAGGAAGPPR